MVLVLSASAIFCVCFIWPTNWSYFQREVSGKALYRPGQIVTGTEVRFRKNRFTGETQIFEGDDYGWKDCDACDP